MCRYQGCRKLVSLLMLVASIPKFLRAIHDVNSTKDLVQIGPVRRLPHHNSAGSTTASTSTVAGSQMDTVFGLTTRNRMSKAFRRASQESEAHISAPTKKLTLEKKVQIRNQLEANRETIMAMTNEYNSFLNSIKELKKQISGEVVNICELTNGQPISGVFRKLEKFHKRFIWRLVQNRVHELGGIRTKLSEIKSVSHSKSLLHRLTRNLAVAFPSIMSFLGEMKLTKNSVGVSRKSPSTQDIGNLLKNTEPLGVNLKQISDSVRLGCMKQVGQEVRPGKRITKHKMNESPEPSTILPSDLLERVIEQANILIVKDLREILQSVIFKIEHRSSTNYESYKEKDLTRIKVEFERCIFRALEFLHRYGFVKEAEVNSFFDCKDTLELTARHLQNLFLVDGTALTAYHVLIPDMAFITNDWHTEHLKCLRVLDEDKRGSLIYLIWKWVKKAQIETISPQGTVTKFPYLEGENLMTDMKNWSPKPWSSISKRPQDDPIRNILEAMINNFRNFPIPEDEQSPSSNFKHRFEFLFNFHILCYFKTYGNENVKAFIKSYGDRDVNANILLEVYGIEEARKLQTISTEGYAFETQFDLITFGFGILRLNKLKHDYEYFLAYPEKYRHMIPKQVTRKSLEELKTRIHKETTKYRGTLSKFHQMLLKHLALRTWEKSEPVNALLEQFYYTIAVVNMKSNWNLWMFKACDHIELSPSNKSQCEALARYLAWYYNRVDRYHDLPYLILDDFKWMFVRNIKLNTQNIVS